MTATDQRPLKEHQRAGIEWIRRERRGLLADEPGLGKSRVAIEAVADARRVLVVAPALVIAGGNWDDEIGKWAAEPDRFQVVPYSQLNDRAKTAKGGSAPIQKLRPEVAGPYDALIVDEAHYTKGRKTSWTWAVEEIAKRTEMVLEMTGTPIPNWPHEIYTVLRAIFPEKAVRGGELGSYWRWAQTWFRIEPSRHNPQARVVGDLLACQPDCLDRPSWDPCAHYQQFAHASFGTRYLRRLRDDCLDLPPLTESVVEVPMDAGAKRAYKELKKEFMTELNGQEVVAWSQGAKNVLLDRVTTSPWLLAPEGSPRGGKLDRLAYDLSSRSRPTLVFAHFRTSVEAAAQVAIDLGLRAAYVHGGVDRAEAGRRVRAFQRGALDVLVGSLETLAEGLTLTVADMLIFLEKSFKPSRNEQAMRRVHRMGQDRPVTVLDYVTPGTVDANKRKLLATKNDRQMRTLTGAEFARLL